MRLSSLLGALTLAQCYMTGQNAGWIPHLVNGVKDGYLLTEIMTMPGGMQTIQAQFAALKSCVFAVDYVRLFVEYQNVLSGPTTVDANMTRTTVDMIALAVTEGLAPLVTGLMLSLPSAHPSWIPGLTDPERLAVDKLFWSALTAEIVSRPNLPAAKFLGFDLQNEPVWIWGGNSTAVVATPCLGISPSLTPSSRVLCFNPLHNRFPQIPWTNYTQNRYGNATNLNNSWGDFPKVGETWANIMIPADPGFFPPNPRQRAYQDFIANDKANWVAELRNAINLAGGSGFAVTVGTLFPFDTRFFAANVTFHSVHLYPDDPFNPPLDSKDKIRNFFNTSAYLVPADGKPIYVTESFPFGARSTGVSAADTYQAYIDGVGPRMAALFGQWFGTCTPDAGKLLEPISYAIYLQWSSFLARSPSCTAVSTNPCDGTSSSKSSAMSLKIGGVFVTALLASLLVC